MDENDLFADFMSQYAYNPYEQDLYPPTEAVDNETAKFLRQQAIAGSGESPLAGFGGEGVSRDIPLVDVNATDYLTRLRNLFKGAGTKAADFATSGQGIMALLSALASYKDRAKPSGGGVGTAYAGYKPLTRTMQGNIARYAADGGIMHAYAQGGAVRPFPMQDGGFVLTADAVRGAGGPRGIAQLVPGARMIRGPGTGTSDSIPATIQGPRGQTPAKVSNGEAYVDPKDVKRRGGAPAMYALMRAMERKA